MSETRRWDALRTIKMRLITRINQIMPRKSPFEFDRENLFPLTNRELPTRLSRKSNVNLSQKCKFDPAELIVKYKMQVNGILHVGAHKGAEIEDYVSAGVRNAMFIEPLQQNFAVLENKIKSHKGYSAHKYAAGEENKRIRIYLSSNGSKDCKDLSRLMEL